MTKKFKWYPGYPDAVRLFSDVHPISLTFSKFLYNCNGFHSTGLDFACFQMAPIDFNVFEVLSWSLRNENIKLWVDWFLYFLYYYFAGLKGLAFTIGLPVTLLYLAVRTSPGQAGEIDTPDEFDEFDAMASAIAKLLKIGRKDTRWLEVDATIEGITWPQKRNKKEKIFTNCKKKSLNDECQETNRGLNCE